MKYLKFDKTDYQIDNREELNLALVNLCRLIILGQKLNSNKFGMVGACLIDPNHQEVFSTSIKFKGKWRHAERNVIDYYQKKYGKIPKGSIIITTLSPCNGVMADRYGGDCTDYINQSNVKKVYCGYSDPSQNNSDAEFTKEITSNKDIQQLCKQFADTFLGDKDHPLDENFADGKNPGRKGLSRRVGIPKKASLSQLSKIAKNSSGEKRRMAQWQLNMRRGKSKKNK